MLTRRDFMVCTVAAGAGALMCPRFGFTKASQPGTAVNFDVPAGACDCHGEPKEVPGRARLAQAQIGRGARAGRHAGGGVHEAGRRAGRRLRQAGPGAGAGAGAGAPHLRRPRQRDPLPLPAHHPGAGLRGGARHPRARTDCLSRRPSFMRMRILHAAPHRRSATGVRHRVTSSRRLGHLGGATPLLTASDLGTPDAKSALIPSPAVPNGSPSPFLDRPCLTSAQRPA